MYDDLLLKYITVAGISWRQSNCDSRDLRNLCETRETDFSRGGARGATESVTKSMRSHWQVLTRSCGINLRSSLVNLMSLKSAFNSSQIWAIWCLFRNFSFSYFFRRENLRWEIFLSQGFTSESNEDALEQLFQNFLFTSIDHAQIRSTWDS